MITFSDSYYVDTPGAPAAGEYRANNSPDALTGLLGMLEQVNHNSTAAAAGADTSATLTLWHTPTERGSADRFAGTRADVIADVRVELMPDWSSPATPTWTGESFPVR